MDIRRTVGRMPLFREYSEARRLIRAQHETGAVLMHPPGHYASPIPSVNDIKSREDEIWSYPRSIPGIETRDQEQLALIDELAELAPDQPFGHEPREGLRYYIDNPWFGHADGMLLHLLVRWTKPRRIIEVGSGFSSAAILDTNDLFFDGAASCTFIEPYPDRLRRLLRPGDDARHRVIDTPVQQVPLDAFDELDAGDVLFIDSSHVSKIGSDVNRLVFEVLPRLRPGVLVHFHDIGWPFEYPRQWIYDGRAWNEAYLLRAFLMFNDAFEIVAFNHYLSLFHADHVSARLPLWGEKAGGSLWLRRCGP
jgi:predicted O-methyltransferase YrrM